MRCIWSDLENDKDLRTNLDRRCLEQSGTSRACPLAQGVVEAFDVVGKTHVFAYSLMMFGGENSAVSPPEVGVADALFVAFGYGVPEQLAGSFTPSTHNTRDDLPGVFA